VQIHGFRNSIRPPPEFEIGEEAPGMSNRDWT
jgi:hypothetical protein